MNVDPSSHDIPSAAPGRPETGSGGRGAEPADLDGGLQEAFRGVLAVPPVLSLLAAELERRLQERGGEPPAEDEGAAEQAPA